MHRGRQEVGALALVLLVGAFAPRGALALGDTTATANDCSIAAGSEASNNTHNCTITKTVNQQDPAVLAAMAKTFAEQIAATTEAMAQAAANAKEWAAKWGFTSAAVSEFFKIVGEQNVPEDKVPTRLIEVATHFAQTRDVLAALEPDDPHAAELAQRAKQALDSGRLTEADALLDQAQETELAASRQADELEKKAREAKELHHLNAAMLVSSRGDIALTRLQYADAAAGYLQAATLVPPGHPDEAAKYRSRQAEALYRQGDERGDNAALTASIETWHLVLQDRSRERVPLDWAMTQNNLGRALVVLGERESGTTRLEEAVAAAPPWRNRPVSGCRSTGRRRRTTSAARL
jgi:hypothetical protein